MPNNAPLLDDLINLAVRAGQEILAVREAGVTASEKADGSLVTQADQRAEALIAAGLKALAPDIPMLGEESFAAGHAPALGSRFFCVDALDSTRDFVEGGRGEFTVNIALVEDGSATMGVVFAPATGELYSGSGGEAHKGAFDGKSGARIAAPSTIQVSAALADGAWRILHSRHSGGARTEDFLQALGPHRSVAASSSIKFCRLAEGRADLYPRFGNVCDWDAAAGHAILSAAGGGVMSLSGEAQRYNLRADHIVPGFIAYASADAETAARAALLALKY
jgi:3'(2'),5'-bisphosphate nucleotidase